VGFEDEANEHGKNGHCAEEERKDGLENGNFEHAICTQASLAFELYFLEFFEPVVFIFRVFSSNQRIKGHPP
jgi:hypothetical protein